MEIPEGLSFEEAAALPVNYLTAYHMLFNVGSLRAGHRVLIHMAAGGVGTGSTGFMSGVLTCIVAVRSSGVREQRMKTDHD